MKAKIACIQLNGSADMAVNIQKIEAMVAEAAGRGAELVALPENAFKMEPHGVKRTLHRHEEHPGIKTAEDVARRHKLWLLAGSVAVKVDHSEKTVNRSLMIDPNGEIVATYDKIHLFDVEVGDGQVYKESAKIIPGKHAVIANTPYGKVGMTVCYDVRFPYLYRSLAQSGANILAVPAAFTKVTGEAHWHVLLRARAIENGCFVIAPAQCGTHDGNRQTFGHSLIVDPWGKVLADGGENEGVIMAQVDLDEVEKARKRIPSLQHERDFAPATR